jgi:hypothetical protein
MKENSSLQTKYDIYVVEKNHGIVSYTTLNYIKSKR